MMLQVLVVMLLLLLHPVIEEVELEVEEPHEVAAIAPAALLALSHKPVLLLLLLLLLLQLCGDRHLSQRGQLLLLLGRLPCSARWWRR